MDEGTSAVKVGIILNPKHARTNRAYSDLMEHMRRTRIRYRSLSTTVWRDGTWQAEQLRDWGAEVIIILGGDGTIRSAAPVLAASRLPVLLVPTGTANVLSRHVGNHTHWHAIDRCVHVLTALSTMAETEPIREVQVPINEVEYRDTKGHWHDSHFVSLAGIGGDARAVAEHTRAPGIFGYVFGGVKALFAPNLAAVIRVAAVRNDAADVDRGPGGANEMGTGVCWKEATRAKSVWSVMASKVSRPAGPIPVFPQARIDGEHFEVLAVGPLCEKPRQRLGQWARVARACLRGHPAAAPAMEYRRGTEVIITPESAAPFQLDGDLIGDCSELRLMTGRARLRVLAPAR